RVTVQSRERAVGLGAPRQLVGVQTIEGRIPAGVRVRLERDDLGPREVQDVHAGPLASSSSRTFTALPCASSPSMPESVMAVGPRPRKPSALSSCTVMRFWYSSSDTPL